MKNVRQLSVTQSPKELEALRGHSVYLLREKLNNGEKLTLDEECYLTRYFLTHQCFGRKDVTVCGLEFDFSDVLHTYYLHEVYGGRSIYYAPSVKSLRKCVKLARMKGAWVEKERYLTETYVRALIADVKRILCSMCDQKRGEYRIERTDAYIAIQMLVKKTGEYSPVVTRYFNRKIK